MCYRGPILMKMCASSTKQCTVVLLSLMRDYLLLLLLIYDESSCYIPYYYVHE